METVPELQWEKTGTGVFKLKPLYSGSLQSWDQQRDENTFYIIWGESGTYTLCGTCWVFFVSEGWGTLHKTGTTKYEMFLSCWNLWCPVNADNWEIQKCAMLGVLISLPQVLAKGVVPYTACVSPGRSSFPLHISVPSTISQGDRASLCPHQDQHPDP